MQIQTLNGYWQFRPVDAQGGWLPASVPGGVHTDLMAAGRIPDPFYGTNEEKVQWVAEKNWEYRQFFYPSAALFNQERIWLIFDGLDTLAEVRLNGRILGQANNMFRGWKWEIKHLLREGENKLEVLFHSPLAYIRNHQRLKKLKEMGAAIRGGVHLRKTPSHFGWDWGPRLPTTGIWRDVRLEGYSAGRLGDIRIDQEHAGGIVTLTARVQCEIWERAEARHTVRLRITGPEHEVYFLDAPARSQNALTVTIANPHLWWPNGYGPEEGGQPLYAVEVELLGGNDEVLDTRRFSIGLRTVELRQNEDSYGRSFQLAVNGVDIFCKGANWIPADSFPTRITPERLETLVSSAAEAHQNMLRVWGGGYYESDAFYDLCDRYGILVWQDFQFACATYPLDDPAYLENTRCEVVENVQRLRHHACLALWCGNNEIEMLGALARWFNKPGPVKDACQQFFYHDLPGILAAEDPGRPYWPGSPCSDQPFKAPCDPKVGDAHLWEVYHGFRLPTYYRQQNPRFVSEFGFQSLPSMATIAEFCPANDRKFGSKVMARHQRATAGNPKLTWYLAQRFLLPRTFEGMQYLSQVYQAEAIREGVEHWRRQPRQTSGVLYWQLNDCWPVISWSSIDYYGRWKALQYAARRFYAPVLLSVEDQTAGQQRKMNVWISNDACSAWEGRVHWTLETLDGEVIEGGDMTVQSAPQSAECLVRLDFARQNGKVDWRRVIFTAELWQGDTRLALQTASFVPENRMIFGDAEIQAGAEVLGDQLLVHLAAKRLARFVEVSLEGADARFSDNFFDLPAGRPLTVTCRLPEGWTGEEAQAALRIRSLNKSGPLDSRVASHWRGDMALLQTLGGLLWNDLIQPAFKK